MKIYLSLETTTSLMGSKRSEGLTRCNEVTQVQSRNGQTLETESQWNQSKSCKHVNRMHLYLFCVVSTDERQ